MIAEIEVFEEPAGQERHRTGRGRSYTPSATLEMQRRVGVGWVEKGLPFFQGAVRLEVEARFRRSKTHYGTGRNAGRLRASAPQRHTVKPDWDNLGKLVSDALRGIAFQDDAAVDDGRVTKRWAALDERPSWWIRVTGEINGT